VNQSLLIGSHWTVKEVAGFLGLSEQSIFTMTVLKRIPFYKIGGAVRFDPQEIRTWRDLMRQGPIVSRED